jgi:hypothetical protein
MKESVFMQMHNGKRTCEGSFNVGLKELFYLADMKNRHKLVAAFPEFFGDEVPEFGIYKKVEPDKTFKYKGWLCDWDGVTCEYNVYTPDELEQPKGYRQAEYECSTKEQCKQFIDSY